MNNLSVFGISFAGHPDQIDRDARFLLARLQKVILQKLHSEQQDLWQALYRIDVPEDKVRNVFKTVPDMEKAAEQISNLIYERMLLKAKIREQYRGS